MTSPWPADGCYGPDALSILNQAFDDAWTEIAGNFGDEPLEVQSARTKLADALLRAADVVGCADADALKTSALRIMALSYVRQRLYSRW